MISAFHELFPEEVVNEIVVFSSGPPDSLDTLRKMDCTVASHGAEKFHIV